MDEDKMLLEIRLLTTNDDLPFMLLMDKIIEKCQLLKKLYASVIEKHHLYNVCDYIVEQGISETKIVNIEIDIKLNGNLYIDKRGISDSNKLISSYDNILYIQNCNEGLLVDVEKRIIYKITKLNLLDKFLEKLGIIANTTLICNDKLLLIGDLSNRILGPMIYLVANPNHVIISENHISVIGPISKPMYIKGISSIPKEIRDWLKI